MTQAQAQQNGTTQAQTLALIKKDAVDVVESRIRALTTGGQLHLPADYSAENAMKSAWLALQEVKDKDGRPALVACTKDSIANSLLDMVVQGLSPAKNQCYFIAYGKTLTCMRSYFGSMALVKRVRPDAEIYWGVVYQGDEFEYALDRGKKRITKHMQALDNVHPDKIRAAYCVIEDAEGRILSSDIMTIEQIRRAWEQGQTKGASPAHKGFPDQMAAKTVINRACKPLINASSDSYLVMAANRSDDAAIDAEVAANANQGSVIDIDDAPTGAAAADDAAPEPTQQNQEAAPEQLRTPGF